MNPIYLEIALNVPLARCFDYQSEQQVIVGARVRVPFGRQNKVGVVMAIKQHSDHPANKIKAINDIIDHKAIIDPTLMQLMRWCSQYYQHPIGEVVLGMLNKKLREGHAAIDPQPWPYQVSATGQIALEQQILKRAPKQTALLHDCLKYGPWQQRQIINHGHHGATWRSLIKKNYLEAIDPLSINQVNTNIFLTLNHEQQQAHETIQSTQNFKVFLLYGVTGSGKTEVYMHWMRDIINAGQQVLVLVPEIALTPQTQARFAARFNTPIVMLHSRMSANEQLSAWYQAHSTRAGIVIGTRSALFISLPKLGGIIIDEEHDGSFKQQEGFRYHARDVAIMRAKDLNIPIVLGSATPSLESYHNATRGRYHLLKLEQRAGEASLPSIDIINTQTHRPTHGFSTPLLNAINQHLLRNKQVLLFLNRRGFAPVLFCEACLWRAMCSQCDAPMTYHQSNNHLSCHHCGHQRARPNACEACQFPDIIHLGLGTEQIEKACATHFPQARILRMDRDTMSHKHSFNQALKRIQAHEVDIIIGTQMMAKGHHFEQLSLVAMLDVDQGIFSSAFRALEHTAQLLTQVSGRAGRGDTQGKVLLQSKCPDHWLFEAIKQHDYSHCLNRLLQERNALRLPPTQHWAIIHARSRHKHQAQQLLQRAKSWLSQHHQQHCECFGPSDCLLARKNNQYQLQLCVQANSRRALQQSIEQLRQQSILPANSALLRWFIDVDPQ